MKCINFLLYLVCFCLFLSFPLSASSSDLRWQDVLQEAKGQQVFWNAWGGDKRFNDFMEWAGSEVNKRYGVRATHVKISSTGDAVKAVLVDKQAGKDSEGLIDLIWINGENFLTMKKNGLLFGPFTELLPNFALVSPEKNPSVVTDFTEPTDGYESPWGMAQLIIIYDSNKTKSPPRHSDEILAYARSHKGRVTYPSPPDFTGVSFLKQVLIEQLEDASVLSSPPTSDEEKERILQSLWSYLDELHPFLWREGRDFPYNAVAMEQMLGDSFIDLSFSFNINAAWLGISAGNLSESVMATTFRDGGLSNVNFVAIPFNAKAKQGAMVLANFLLSPEAQGMRQDPEVWGDPSVLDFAKLSDKQKSFFEYDLPESSSHSVLDLSVLQKIRQEPHSAWSIIIQDEWQRRYSQN